MDSVWAFRSAYGEARKIKSTQGDYRRKTEAGEWDSLIGQDHPDTLQWDSILANAPTHHPIVVCPRRWRTGTK